jgi:hypothetical protein
MSLGWYFLFALFFLLVVILSVPSDGATLPHPAVAISMSAPPATR